MTQYGTWVSYSGDARIWLAAVLLAAATGTAIAGIRLRRPIRAVQPGPAGRIAMILAWVGSMVAFLICFVFYVQQYVHAYGSAASSPKDRIAPITLTAVAATFVIIIWRRTPDVRTRLAAGFFGAIAAPMIFELPFDLIVINRTLAIPPSPVLYRLLFFVPLFVVEISTISLLTLSPLTRVTKYTAYSLASMFLIFAVWALIGFEPPNALAPYVLNSVSKVLCFVTAITLFVTVRAPGYAPPPAAPQGTAVAP